MKQIYSFLIFALLAAGCVTNKHLPDLAQERKSLPDSLWMLPKKTIEPAVFFMVPGSYDIAKLPLSDGLLHSRYYSTISQAIDSVYSIRQFAPLWLNYSKDYRQICEVALQQMQSANLHGLNPSDYKSEEIRIMLSDILTKKKVDSERYKELELTLTAHYLLFNYDLNKGRVNPYKISKNWFLTEKNIYLSESLAGLSSSRDLQKHFESIVPKAENYELLTRQLAYYRDLQKKNGWQQIRDWPSKHVIEPESSDAFVPIIRRRLALTEVNILKDKMPVDSLKYDSDLISAVRQFQHRHGLVTDGRIGAHTVEMINISTDTRIEQIILNLERLRWLPSDLGKDYLIVNLPEYKLHIYKNRKLDLDMRVIVGKKTTSTPIFKDTLKYLVFSPTWTVPMSIKSVEMLSRLQTNSSYYSNRDFKFYNGWNLNDEVDPKTIDWSQYSENNFPFTAVQQPGPSNALGLVKFIMPNDLSIYLHDTPTDYLFERNERAFSHGCIRVEKPDVLAEYLLKPHKGWDMDAVHEAMQSDEPIRVDFKEDLPVYLVYLTSFVDELGLINFRDDIYGYDQQQLKKIQ